MNFLSAEIRMEEGGLVAHAPGLRIPVPARCREALFSRADHKVILGVRPEHLSITPTDKPIGAAQVEVVEQLGAELVIETLVEGQAITVSRMDPTLHITAGQKVDLHVTSEQLHFFDPETEWRIQ